MGVPAFNIATSVSLIIAQRLGRRLCSACKEPADIPKQVLVDAGMSEELITNGNFFQPKGCDACNKGYKGRVGIYEVVKITPALSTIIMNNGNSLEIAAVAREEGFNNLRISALEKVSQGVTSLAEANRITAD